MLPGVPPRSRIRSRIRFWGTRGTCPAPGPRTVRYGGNTPCVEVRVPHDGHDDSILILDAGSGIRGLGLHLLETADASPLHLFLTHRHSDHVLGLAHFAPLFTRTCQISVCCGDGEATSLEAFITSLLTPPMFPSVDGLQTRLALCEWEQCTSRRAGSAEVHRFTARHPGDAAIFRVDDADGPLIAYAPDNELAYHDASAGMATWRARLAEFLRDIPILVHDATYRHEELPYHVGWGHSSALEATRLAIECGTGMLVLFHHHPDRDDETVERMVEECRDYAVRAGSGLRVLAAWEGLALTI